MQTTTDHIAPTDRKLVVIRASEIKLDPAKAAEIEAGYRRGVHQALALAYDLAERGGASKAVLGRLARAERIACDLRYHRKHEGGGMLIDYIQGRVGQR